MPLNCDCYPGCWGDHSKDWPLIPLDERNASQLRADVGRLVPYGSYVEVEGGIRIEPGYSVAVK